MTIPAIDSLSRALYVPSVTAEPKTQARALANRTPFETTIAPSRSKGLTQQALDKGVLVNSIIEGISSLIKLAEKTALPTNFPNSSRVTLQAEITTLLKSLNDVVNAAEIGSVSLLRSESRTILLETNELGGAIKVQGVAVDADALGLSKINILSDLGIKDASSSIDNALYSVKARLDRLNQLDQAVNNRLDYGRLSYPSGETTSSLALNSLSSYAPPISYGSAVSGQYQRTTFNRGSFINLIG